jgi:hypothetical protein
MASLENKGLYGTRLKISNLTFIIFQRMTRQIVQKLMTLMVECRCRNR